MKINKVQTSSFAINRKVEEGFLKAVKSGKGDRGYYPVGKFKVVRSHKVEKGKFFKSTTFDKTENYFYINMFNGDLYYSHRNSVWGGTPNLVKSDFLARIMDYNDSVLSVIGSLYEYGSIDYEALDHGVINELLREGLVRTYEPEVNQLFNFYRLYVEDDQEIYHKVFVKLNMLLPNFDNRRYNLDRFVDVVDFVDDEYRKESIRFSHERIIDVLGYLYGGAAMFTELVYLPFNLSVKTVEGKQTEVYTYPICAKGSHEAKREFATKEKLKPISFMTEMGVSGSVPVESSTITFADVADMTEVKQKIKEAIIYPLKNPQLAKQYQKKGGGSILLYGPPGCGKTYIARATVGECGVNFFNINTSDILSGGSEEAAKNIHDAFMRSSKASPSILFFDEVDALGARREDEEGSARMVVNQFLMEMDGVESLNENVLVLGGTNIPWALDPALRRAGRFTQQIFIPPPDYEARVELFKIHTRKRPIDENIKFDKLAELTEDYSSADIKAVCDDALEVPWTEALEGKPSRKSSMEDFLSVIHNRSSSITAWYRIAEKHIKESGEVDLYPDLAKYILTHAGGVEKAAVPPITFSDVADLSAAKEIINRVIIYPMKNPQLAKKFGQVVGGGVLLYGPPGCGKTYLARATAGECKANFFNVRITDVISAKAGESEMRLHSIFERAAQNAPAIVFFDEIDALAPRREDMVGDEKRLVNQFLTELDGFQKLEGVMVVGGTNAPWDVDPALRRSGRFTNQVYVSPPDAEVRKDIFRIHTKNKPVAADLNLEVLAEKTEGYSSADIKALCDHALEIPWVEALHGGKERPAGMDDFLRVVKNQANSLHPWFQLAVRQLKESGEADFYKEMLSDIEAALSKVDAVKERKDAQQSVLNERLTIVENRAALVAELKRKKDELTKYMEKLRHTYANRGIDEATFKMLVGQYQKELIEVEVKIDELEGDGTQK
ncbi:VCP-like ATPase [uncultured archaeon]|nr:VCP-like ATPase [uncultured archaeon]